MSEADAGPAALDLRRTTDLETAYRRHAGELHRFVTRHLRDATTASDVVQEVFVRAWRHAGRYDATVGSLRVWLFTIARNLIVDQVRHDRARPGRPTDPGVLGEVAERTAREPRRSFSEDLVTAWFLEEALERIGADQRVAIVETALRGRPYAEVAAELDVPVGTLRSRVFHGLRNLRSIMEETGVPW
ncbi:RNA polymerase sigma factor [Actinomycetospora termitidis]|uniref:Sigma-70 family RNA polymerase sigma factor n=1 Tax=Actinomycetospora termitidis TaxID=3053470 RepID=A0ABT7MAA4_9PSEU|nr:sigma-70 family RNA polymerase sigma factor [Actinomycetospora sp. Odt1-22]MDL5157139.1 sigma-70 family RNA polymerase sigma factor [Actinomycetospora sp. Odt1-22]